MKSIIPFYRPYKFDKYFEDVILQKTKRILRKRNYTAGYYVEQFEDLLKDYFQVDHAILCNSGSTALLLILKSLCPHTAVWNVGYPVYTWKSVPTMIEWCGYSPIPLDIDRQTWNLLIGVAPPRFQVIIPTHIYGNVTHLYQVHPEINVIYDASHAWGITLPDIGTATFLSMHGAKMITSAGEGGVILTNDEFLVEGIKEIQTYFGNITEIQAMIGLHYLFCLPDIYKEKKEIWEYYAEKCAEIGGVTQKIPIDHAYGYFGCLFSPKNLEWIKIYARRKKVEIRQYYHPISERFPNAKYIAERSVCLPCYPGVPKEEVIKRLFEGIR